MSVRARNEEKAPLGEFMLQSFKEDQKEIEVRFPELNDAFVVDFQAKLEVVKDLESTLVYDTNEATVTKELYAEADAFNKEMNFLSSYFKGVGLATTSITKLKEKLVSRNIEGALLELKAVRQLARENKAALESKGMKPDFPDVMDVSYASMTTKNVLQNKIMDDRKDLVDANKADYDALYACVSTVAEKGKIVFDGSRKEEKYTITDVIKRMRAPKKKDDDEPEA